MGTVTAAHGARGRAGQGRSALTQVGRDLTHRPHRRQVRLGRRNGKHLNQIDYVELLTWKQKQDDIITKGRV